MIPVLGGNDPALGGGKPPLGPIRAALAYLFATHSEEVLLVAVYAGRAKGYGVPIPLLNTGATFAVTSHRWLLLRDGGRDLLASGPIADVQGTGWQADGLHVRLGGDRRVRFVRGAPGAKKTRGALESAVACTHGHVVTQGPALAKAQSPVVLAGEHYGGYGTPLARQSPAILALTGSTLAVWMDAGLWLRPVAELRGVQLGGEGVVQTGGGWIGGGFGVAGALEGAALASIMNWMTTSTRMDTLARFVFDDAELTFAVTTHAPGALEIDLAATLAALRGSPVSGASTLGLHTVAQRDVRSRAEETGPPKAFCPGCGDRQTAPAAFCSACGLALTR